VKEGKENMCKKTFEQLILIVDPAASSNIAWRGVWTGVRRDWCFRPVRQFEMRNARLLVSPYQNRDFVKDAVVVRGFHAEIWRDWLVKMEEIGRYPRIVSVVLRLIMRLYQLGK